MTSLVRRESKFLPYLIEDDRTRVEVRFDGDTAWLSFGQVVELFHRDKGSRVKSHRGPQFRIWATSPGSQARHSVRGPRAHRTGPRGAHR
jgi:hypothetical protein